MNHTHLQLTGSAEAGALGELRHDGRVHLVVGVAADGGPPAAHVVDVGVAIHVGDLAALDAVEHDGLAAHGSESPDGAVHTTGQQGLGLVEDALRVDLVQLGGCLHGLHRHLPPAAASLEHGRAALGEHHGGHGGVQIRSTCSTNSPSWFS
eukprot:1151628-Pelagomonas_calceolata.AAC.8